MNNESAQTFPSSSPPPDSGECDSFLDLQQPSWQTQAATGQFAVASPVLAAGKTEQRFDVTSRTTCALIQPNKSYQLAVSAAAPPI